MFVCVGVCGHVCRCAYSMPVCAWAKWAEDFCNNREENLKFWTSRTISKRMSSVRICFAVDFKTKKSGLNQNQGSRRDLNMARARRKVAKSRFFVFFCVCACVYMCTFVCACDCVHVYVRACVCMYVHAHTRVCVVSVRVRVCAYVLWVFIPS